MYSTCYCAVVFLLVCSSQINGQRMDLYDVSSKFSIGFDWEQNGIEFGAVITAFSVSECIDRCYRDIHCKGFVWRADCRSEHPKICYLKSSIAQGGSIVIGSISGYRSQVPMVNAYGKYYNPIPDRRNTANNYGYQQDDRRTANNYGYQQDDRRTVIASGEQEGRKTADDYNPKQDEIKVASAHGPKQEDRKTSNDHGFKEEDKKASNDHGFKQEDRKTSNDHGFKQEDRKIVNNYEFAQEDTNIINDTKEPEHPISNRYGLSEYSCQHGGEKTGLVLYPTDIQHKNVVLLLCDHHYGYRSWAGTKHDQLLKWYYNRYRDSKQFQAISRFFWKADGTLTYDHSNTHKSNYYTDKTHTMDASERNLLRTIIERRIFSYPQ